MGKESEDEMVRAILRAEEIKLEIKRKQDVKLHLMLTPIVLGFCAWMMYIGLKMVGILR
jgi:hypothetical protein